MQRMCVPCRSIVASYVRGDGICCGCSVLTLLRVSFRFAKLQRRRSDENNAQASKEATLRRQQTCG
jgi:hypothetical protein